MEFTMELGGLPVGLYRVRFEGVESFDKHAEYGPAVAMKFVVLDGEFVGQTTTRICPAKMTMATGLGRWASAIKGSAIGIGERFSFADHVGAIGELSVMERPDKSTRPESFKRTGTAPVATSAPPAGEMRF